MRKIFFLILLFFFSYNCFSQEATNDEFEIYGRLIGEQGYQFYPINFEIPLKFKLKLEDSIYKEIEKIMPNKDIDIKKIFAVSLKYSIGGTFKVLESNINRQIYFSPIYFKSKSEAFFICVATDNLPKPLYAFYQAKKINNEWTLSDYYIMN